MSPLSHDDCSDCCFTRPTRPRLLCDVTFPPLLLSSVYYRSIYFKCRASILRALYRLSGGTLSLSGTSNWGSGDDKNTAIGEIVLHSVVLLLGVSNEIVHLE